MAGHKKKKPKEITTQGLRIKAGQLLSQFLRKIAEEKTELATIDGEDKLITKTEALGRLLWRMALGYTENIIKDSGVRAEVIHPPDRAMIHLLFDRIEGRTPLMADMKPKRTVADKITEQGKLRIVDAGKSDV